MSGEPPEWMLWAMFGLMAFIMLIPLLKALAPLARRLGADLGEDTPQQLDARG